MRIDPADEERPGLGLCAEFICVKVAILIDRRPHCDCRLSWWIRFIMLWSLGMSYYRTASSVDKLSLMFSRMRFGSFAMRPKRTITMLTACRDVLLLVNGCAFIITESFKRIGNVHKSKENTSSLEICYLCPERIHPHCTSLQLACGLLQHWRPWQILAVLDTPLEKKVLIILAKWRFSAYLWIHTVQYHMSIIYGHVSNLTKDTCITLICLW